MSLQNILLNNDYIYLLNRSTPAYTSTISPSSSSSLIISDQLPLSVPNYPSTAASSSPSVSTAPTQIDFNSFSSLSNPLLQNGNRVKITSYGLEQQPPHQGQYTLPHHHHRFMDQMPFEQSRMKESLSGLSFPLTFQQTMIPQLNSNNILLMHQIQSNPQTQEHNLSMIYHHQQHQYANQILPLNQHPKFLSLNLSPPRNSVTNMLRSNEPTIMSPLGSESNSHQKVIDIKKASGEGKRLFENHNHSPSWQMSKHKTKKIKKDQSTTTVEKKKIEKKIVNHTVIDIKRNACELCTHRKSRCVKFSEDKCKRCHELGLECIFKYQRKRGRPAISDRAFDSTSESPSSTISVATEEAN